jgi:hypothetical protein
MGLSDRAGERCASGSTAGSLSDGQVLATSIDDEGDELCISLDWSCSSLSEPAPANDTTQGVRQGHKDYSDTWRGTPEWQRRDHRHTCR